MPPPHHRRSLRRDGYDYAQAGAYFVTLRIHRRLPLHGNDLLLSAAGTEIQEVWDQLPTVLAGVSLDTRRVMHDHLHGIVVLESGLVSLPRVVQAFKSTSTAVYAHGAREARWPPYCGVLWQRGYYDHVVRDEDDLHRIRDYIEQNPLRTAMRVRQV